MNSYFDYVEGSATAEYRKAVDQAASIAEQQKRKVDPIHHEKIDQLLDTYAQKLAENTNKRNAIATRVPSILVAGGGNFPVRKKEKQNRADEAAINGCFFYKANHAQELMEDKTVQPIRVEVVKVIQLSAQQFQHFSANLLRDMPFITANKSLSGYDKGVRRCLLMTTRRNRDGILVDCQGYNYARYSAYVPDKRSLDLRDVPVDHYDLKLRQPRSQQEQR